MAEPDFLICMECDSPVYTFEWVEGRLREVVCPVCGNEDVSSFVTEEELEDMAMQDEEADE